MSTNEKDPALAGEVFEETALSEGAASVMDITPDFDFTDNEELQDAQDAEVAVTYTRSLNTIAEEVTERYLDDNGLDRLRSLAPAIVSDELLSLINAAIEDQGTRLKEGDIRGVKVPAQQDLRFPEIARLIAALYSIVKIAPNKKNADPDLEMLAVYEDSQGSEHYGTYRSSLGHLRSIARRYSRAITTATFVEVLAALADSVPTKTRGGNRDLLAVRNGIVDYNGGSPIFMPFDPAHIFISKLDVDWNEKAENVVIHNPDDSTDWDVESWMGSLTDDPEVCTLLWEIIGATVRPYVSWNKAAFFYSTEGNNGKGTLISLMRNILGEGNYASIPLSDFGKDFLLEPLTRASAILVDENDVGSFIERGANFKAVITNDVITINRKYKSAIAHQHFGFMVQCVNAPPTTKDKSESLYRRQTFVPFEKSFTGAERKYIKDEYLHRQDVLEYVLKRVLTMSYYSLSEPQAIIDALEEFKIENDPTRGFWDDVAGELTWDLVPFSYLYDLYKSWFAANCPTGKVLGAQKFRIALLSIIKADPEWTCEDPKQVHRPGTMMSIAQPLTAEYDLVGWTNHAADKRNPTARSTMSPDMFKQSYAGLLRSGVTSSPLDGLTLGAAGIPPMPDTPTLAEVIA